MLLQQCPSHRKCERPHIWIHGSLTVTKNRVIQTVKGNLNYCAHCVRSGAESSPKYSHRNTLETWMSVKRCFLSDHALSFLWRTEWTACLYVYSVYKHINICMCDVYMCLCVRGGISYQCVSVLSLWRALDMILLHRFLKTQLMWREINVLYW